MRLLTGLLFSLFAAVGCGADHPQQSVTTGPRNVRTPAGCARALSDGRYINDKLGVGCHFARFNGARVCIPDGLPVIISASCDPQGSPTGPGKVQVDLSKDHCATGLSRFVLTRKDNTAPLSCDDIEGHIREVLPEAAADQRIYLGADNLHCQPSGLSAKLPDFPFVKLVEPAVLLYEDDMPATVCP